MAPPPTPVGLPTPQQEIMGRARGLGRALGFPSETFAGREQSAFGILANAAAMPVIADKGRRRTYGNEILVNADRALHMSLPPNARFNAYLRGVIVTMQEFPVWYARLSRSNEDLVDEYVLGTSILEGMEFVGLGGLQGLGAAGLVGGAKGLGKAANVRGAAQARAFARGAAQGVKEVVTGGIAEALPAGARGLMATALRRAAAVYVVGTLAYPIMKQEHKKTGEEIERRYQEQRLSEKLYRRAFSEGALPQRYFYPVK